MVVVPPGKTYGFSIGRQCRSGQHPETHQQRGSVMRRGLSRGPSTYTFATYPRGVVLDHTLEAPSAEE